MKRAIPTSGLSAAAMNRRPGRKEPKQDKINVRDFDRKAQAVLERRGMRGSWRQGMGTLFNPMHPPSVDGYEQHEPLPPPEMMS